MITSCVLPTGDLAHNPGICPDWESNWQPFGLQASTQYTEPHQPGLFSSLELIFSQARRISAFFSHLNSLNLCLHRIICGFNSLSNPNQVVFICKGTRTNNFCIINACQKKLQVLDFCFLKLQTIKISFFMHNLHFLNFSECLTMSYDFVKTFLEGQVFLIPKLETGS